MAHVLPPLPYDYAALEPSIDEQTMRIHHDKHHAAYVNNLNTALEGQAALQAKSLDDLIANLDAVPESIRTAVRNNGGGHHNHTMFWEIMTPGGAKEPQGTLADAITKTFGGVAQFKETFSKACLSRFGSGWGWLVRKKDGSLEVYSTANQDSPVKEGKKPLVGCDVWEHAYYLKYQNRRPDYVAAWWNVVNWTEVGKRFTGK
ncbi:MAG TPA: superoxide dismutase [Gemmatimonadales bacterium]|nr:superoxide dismutase [Gemmatimonadales bacterium]